jgi:hypothetical protein
VLRLVVQVTALLCPAFARASASADVSPVMDLPGGDPDAFVT